MSDFDASPPVDETVAREPEAAGSEDSLDRINDNDSVTRSERVLGSEASGQSATALSGVRPDTTADVEHATFVGTELTLADTLEGREFAERLSPSERSSGRHLIIFCTPRPTQPAWLPSFVSSCDGITRITFHARRLGYPPLPIDTLPESVHHVTIHHPEKEHIEQLAAFETITSLALPAFFNWRSTEATFPHVKTLRIWSGTSFPFRERALCEVFSNLERHVLDITPKFVDPQFAYYYWDMIREDDGYRKHLRPWWRPSHGVPEGESLFILHGVTDDIKELEAPWYKTVDPSLPVPGPSRLNGGTSSQEGSVQSDKLYRTPKITVVHPLSETVRVAYFTLNPVTEDYSNAIREYPRLQGDTWDTAELPDEVWKRFEECKAREAISEADERKDV